MAVHSGAEASRAPATKPFYSGSRFFVSANSALFTHQRYSRTELLDIKETADLILPPELWQSRLRRQATKRKRCARKQKRGKRPGWLAQLSGLLAAFQLDGLQLFQADRDQRSGKTWGGGLCVYINKGWCTNCGLVKSHCSEALEYLTVKCRPFYLPHEFTAVLVTIVYISLGANANNKVSEALQELHDIISSLQTKHPEAFYVVVGDFNHIRLTDVLPRFHQHVDFPTRGNNTLDCVYSNICRAYRARPRPHLRFSDHISILLAPAYCPLRGRSRPTKRTVTVARRRYLCSPGLL